MLAESYANDRPILIVSDKLEVNANAERLVLHGEHRKLLLDAFRRAGLSEDKLGLVSLSSNRNEPTGDDLEAFRSLCSKSQAQIIVPISEFSLNILTGLDGLHNQHCSILETLGDAKKCIPLLSPYHVYKVYADSAYLTFGAMRIAQELRDPKPVPKRRFILAQDYKTARDYILDRVIKAPELALDIETGSGMINTMGFAVSETDAVAIRTSPELYTPEEHYNLWRLIANVCESSQSKICANFIYEQLFLSSYGIRLANVTFDTQWAMKLLHPEFDKGLHNAGRLYTRYPFWKNDRDEWNNVKHWIKHLDYNCKDTTGTFAACINMRKDLKERGLANLYHNYLQQFKPCIVEMCSRGLPLDREKHLHILSETRIKTDLNYESIQNEFKARLGREVNPRSPAQLQKALKEIGFALPTKRTKTGDSKETADKKALIKLYKKHPKESILMHLTKLSAQNKELSSYLEFGFDANRNVVNYTLDGNGTETGRWSSYTDPWGRGFNAQTIPKWARKMFHAPEGRHFIQIDLAQAESRYVAYEAPEPTLMQMLQEGRDVHKYVAAKIFGKSEDRVTKTERQLGKKSGHSANYGVGPRTFAEACLVEMNLSISEREAQRIINAYYEVFPGIKNRQTKIQQAIRATKSLRTPLGRERIFYDRISDSTFREAYAYAPQSVIPDITNHLMLFLRKTFDMESLWLHLQIHDALLLSVPKGFEEEIAAAARDYEAWHPVINLAGGRLVIPVDVEYGSHWEPMEKL